jgi:hypothetical protein
LVGHPPSKGEVPGSIPGGCNEFFNVILTECLNYINNYPSKILNDNS